MAKDQEEVFVVDGLAPNVFGLGQVLRITTQPLQHAVVSTQPDKTTFYCATESREQAKVIADAIVFKEKYHQLIDAIEAGKVSIVPDTTLLDRSKKVRRFDFEKVPSMKMRKIEPKTLKNKTIKAVDASSVNCINLQLTDGTIICVESVNAGGGVNGFELSECSDG